MTVVPMKLYNLYVIVHKKMDIDVKSIVIVINNLFG